MDSAKYWKEAAEAREAAVHLEAKEQIEKLLRLYENAYEDIRDEIEKIRYNYSLRFGMDKQTAEWFLSREINKGHMDELAHMLLNADSDEERAAILEFIQRDGLSTRAYGARAGRYKDLEDVISLRMLALQAEVRELGKGIIKNAYKNNYYRLIDDVAFGLDCGVSFTLIDDDALEAVMSKPWYGKRFSERVWKNTQKLADDAQEIVGRYIISGRSQDKAIRELRDRFDVAETRATTLIRTEIAHARSEGDLKGYNDLDVEYYKYMATLDERTCEVCGPLDGQRFMVSEAAEGVNYPVMHPRCRCTTTIDMKWTSRHARNPVTGHNDVIDGSVTYEQWRDGMNPEEKAAFEAARKKYQNKAADKLQHSRYREVLGKDVPRSLDNFQKLKYNDSEKWAELKTLYRHTAYGFTSGALNPYSPRAIKHAEQYYNSVRKMKTDVSRISSNTGWKEEAIQKIKNHIFYDKHKLIGGYGRFDPNYNMAISWQRLIEGKGKIRNEDIVLLKHEYLELTLVKNGYTQDEAHILSSKKHDYAKMTEEK